MSTLEHHGPASPDPFGPRHENGESLERAASLWLPGRSKDGVRTYRGRSLEALLPQIRRELGPDAVILREREGLVGGIGGFFATRFVEIQARAGGPSLDVYDEEDAAVPPPPSAGTSVSDRAAATAPDPVDPAADAPLAADASPAVEAGAVEAEGEGEPARVSDFGSRLDAIVRAWDDPAEQPPVIGSVELAQAAALDAIVDDLEAERDDSPELPVTVEVPEPTVELMEGGADADTEPARDARNADGQGTPKQVTAESSEPAPDPGAAPEDSAGTADSADGGAVLTEGAGEAGFPPEVILSHLLEEEPTPVLPQLREPDGTEVAVVAADLSTRRFGRRTKLPAQPAAPRALDGAAASRALSRLTELGSSAGFARELIADAAAHGATVAGGLHAAVRTELARRLPAAPRLPSSGGTIALVGAGGSGKTVAAAGLACAYRHGSSLPVSVTSLCDPHAAGRLAHLLAPDEVPVIQAVDDSPRAAAALAERVRSERDAGVVVIDTPSVMPADAGAVDALAQRLAPLDPDAIIVVLPATLSPTAARRALAGLGALAPSGMLISHADESDQLGVLVELAVAARLPIWYLTAGTDHRRSLVGTDPASLARLLLT